MPAITLDEYFRSRGIESASFVKVDVKGAEPLVQRGAESLLQAHRIGALLIEVCPGNLKDMGFRVSDIVAPLSWHGYRLHTLRADGMLGEACSEEQLQAQRLVNVAAVPVA